MLLCSSMERFSATRQLHQIGMLTLSHTDLHLQGLAWYGRLVEPPVQLWQLLCQLPHT